MTLDSYTELFFLLSRFAPSQHPQGFEQRWIHLGLEDMCERSAVQCSTFSVKWRWNRDEQSENRVKCPVRLYLEFRWQRNSIFRVILKTQTNLGICSLCPLTTLIEKIFLRLRLSAKMLFTILFFLLIPDTSETRLDDLLFGLLLCGMERVFYSRERKLSLSVNGKWWAMIFFMDKSMEKCSSMASMYSFTVEKVHETRYRRRHRHTHWKFAQYSSW